MIGQNIYDPPYPPRQTAGLAAAEGIVCHFLAPTRFPLGRCFCTGTVSETTCKAYNVEIVNKK